MSDLERHVDSLCSAPVGCAFLLIIEEAKIAPDVAVRPAVAVNAAAIALSWLRPFRPDHDWIASSVLAEGPRLRDLALRLLSSAGADRVFGSLDRSAQLWVSENGRPLDPNTPITPIDPPDEWERYAQKPARRTVTSTLVDGTSSRLAAFAHHVGDSYLQPPISQYLARITPNERIFEVENAHDWHRLCVAFPAEGEDGSLVPDWSAVAHEWDGVHLTLCGLMASEQVRVESSEGWSRHWGWDAEQTLWLRSCFASIERVPDVTSLPEPPVTLNWPRWIFDMHIDRIQRGKIPGHSSVVLTSESEPGVETDN